MKRAILLLSAVPAMLALFGCPSESQKVEVSTGDPRSREIARHLVDLKANDPQVQAEAARQLGNMRAESGGAISALKDGLTDDSPIVRQASAQALADIGTYDALSALRDTSHRGWPEARDTYNSVTKDLRSQSQAGDMGARNLLDRLGEKGLRHTGAQQ